MNEDREEHKAREHGVNYGMGTDAYRDAGRIRGREMAESLARIRAAFEGIAEGMGDATGPRKVDEGRLDLDTAYECAMVEYVWRMRVDAAVKGRLSWKSKAMDYRNEWDAAMAALGNERTARRRAESGRDGYKAQWEERGERIEELNASLAKARPWYTNADTSPATATAEALKVERDALRTALKDQETRNDALRVERDGAQARWKEAMEQRDALELDLYRARRDLERSGYTGRGIDGYLMIDSPVTPLVKYVYPLGEDDRAMGPHVASVRRVVGAWESYTEPEGTYLDRHTSPEAAFATIRRYLGDGA